MAREREDVPERQEPGGEESFEYQVDQGEDPGVSFAEMSAGEVPRAATEANLTAAEQEEGERFGKRGRRIIARAAAGTVGVLVFVGAGLQVWRRLRQRGGGAEEEPGEGPQEEP